MYGIAIKASDVGYTPDLNEAFKILGNLTHKYNWLLSDYECTCYPSEKIPFNKHFVWLDGSDFTSILNEYPIRFIWGVATAYKKDIELSEVLKHSLPFADNPVFLQIEATMQHPFAEMEIVPYDSSFLFVISKSKDIIDKFINEYPQAQSFAEYNRSRTI